MRNNQLPPWRRAGPGKAKKLEGPDTFKDISAAMSTPGIQILVSKMPFPLKEIRAP